MPFAARLLLAVASSLVAVTAHAGPLECLQDYFSPLFSGEAGAAPKYAMPTTDSARIALHPVMWPTGAATRATFAAMVDHKRFECAELAFGDLDRDGFTTTDGLAKTVDLLSSARDVARWNHGLGAVDVQKLMEAWKAQAPDSVIADIYWVRLLNAAAWDARGSGFANQVSPEQWRKFEALNADARARIQAASPQAKAHRLWPYAVRWVMADSDVPQQQLEDYVFDSLKRFPEEIDYLALPAERLSVNWGGSPRQFERFAQRALAATRSTHGNKVYARLYTLYVPPRQLSTNAEVKIDVLRAGLIESTQEPFHPQAFNNLQAFACARKDESAFRAAAHLLTSYTPEQRAAVQSADSACQQWALQLGSRASP